MGFRLGRLAGRLGLALLTAAALLGATPVSATPQDSQTHSLLEELESLATELEAQSERAIAAAAQAARRTIEENKDTLADAKSDLAVQLDRFRTLLNEQKAKLDMIGEDAAATLDAWTQAAAESWAETHRSTLEAIERLRQWLEEQSESDEPIPV